MIHHVKRGILVCVLGIMLTVPLTAGGARAVSLTCGAWSIVPSPNHGGSNFSVLNGVATISSNNVWAVGDYTSTKEISQTLIEHWNGTRWRIVHSPNSGSGGNALFGIAAVSASDIWAVGIQNGQTLILHWNGAKWSIVPSPNPGTNFNRLEAVAVVSANNIWAVGFSDFHTLILHWDGTSWSVVSSPSPGQVTGFSGVAVVSVSDIWAVGSYFSNVSSQPLILHWNGTSWSVVPGAVPTGSPGGLLSAVTAISASNVWAVGSYTDSNFNLQTLIERWDGTEWSVVSSPNPAGSGANSLRGVAAVSASNIWAVGRSLFGLLTEHWDGITWSIVPAPRPAGSDNTTLSAVATISASAVWAVGNSVTSTGSNETLTEFFC